MLIRSQNRLRLVNMENIDTLAIGLGSFQIYSFLGNESTLLGTYSTEEKVVKVLDMIQESYVTNKGYYLSGNKSRTSYVFYMPQDDEVEL